MKKQIGKILLGCFSLLALVTFLLTEYHFEIREKEVSMYFMAKEHPIQAWKKEDTYYLFLPSYVKMEEVSLAAFSPEFYVIEEGETISKKESIKGLPQKEDLLCQWVETKEHFTLQILQSANIPAVFLETQTGDLEKIKQDKEYRTSGTLDVIDEKGNKEEQRGLDVIRGRGNTSFAGYEKKPFSIKLKEEDSILGLPSGENYALLSNASDPSLIRNDLARGMEEKLGLKGAHRGRFVDLYIDGSYEGNYYLCDDIEIGADRIPLKDMEAATDLVYNSSNYESEELYETETAKGRLLSVSLEDVTGGYLLEREYAERFNYEYEEIKSGFITENKEHFVVKNPSYCSKEQIEYIRKYVNDTEEAILNPRGKNLKTQKAYTDYIDLESFVKKYLAEEVSKNYDGGVSSSYFYKDSDENGGKLCAAPGWDYDMSLGNYVEWMEDFSADPTGISELTHHTYASVWYTNLYEKEEFYHLVEEYYNVYISPFLEDLQKQGLENYQVNLKESAFMDEVRWLEELKKNPYYESREKTFLTLKEFISKRKEYLDQAWNRE